MSGLHAALTALCDRYRRTLAPHPGMRLDVSVMELRRLLAAHPAEPAPVVDRDALVKTITKAGHMDVGGTRWPLDRENVREIADAVLALINGSAS